MEQSMETYYPKQPLIDENQTPKKTSIKLIEKLSNVGKTSCSCT
jgi:hypothetical protein